MGRVEDLAERYARHIGIPWQRAVSGAQRVIMAIYHEELERTLRARKGLFENATRQAGHGWLELDLTDAFATWLAEDEYRDAYFERPDDLRIKLDAEFTPRVADRIRRLLTDSSADENAVVAVFGTGSLLGFTHVSEVLTRIERDVRGRLLMFFPGRYEQNNYRLLDQRDGWNYLAYPLTLDAPESMR